MRHIFNKSTSAGVFSAVISIAVLILFHRPFLAHAISQTDGGFNAAVIVGSLAALLLLINWFVCYALLTLCRLGGRILIAISFICNAVALYFINSFDVILDDTMMGNVLNTNSAEAGAFYSSKALLYILILGVLPALWVLLRKVDYGRVRKMLRGVGIALALILGISFANITNWPWIDRNSTVLGSLILPWSYTVNIVRYKIAERQRNREEIPLPDAQIADSTRSAVVLVIGESARRDHFSLYGYERRTNPLLEETPNLKAYKANSAATYTIGGVKAILDHKASDKLYEILPNYLFRAGVDVIWRTSNWGEPPLHIEKHYDVPALRERYPDCPNPGYDELLAYGIADEIRASRSPKVLVILHTSTSHGPSYETRYPPVFEQFTPVNHEVEMSKSVQQEVFNSYDNSILYTDWILSGIINSLETLDGWKTCMMFVSDHGESLGEGNLYMHGVPISIAPKEQYEIPFIVWTKDKECRDEEMLGQYNVFPSVLDFLGVSSPAADYSMSIFR